MATKCKFYKGKPKIEIQAKSNARIRFLKNMLESESPKQWVEKSKSVPHRMQEILVVIKYSKGLFEENKSESNSIVEIRSGKLELHSRNPKGYIGELGLKIQRIILK